jgi:hypothetical protein
MLSACTPPTIQGEKTNQICLLLSTITPAQEFFAVVNQSEGIREQQREMSIRPEMARAAIDQSRPASEQEMPRAAATVER